MDGQKIPLTPENAPRLCAAGVIELQLRTDAQLGAPV